MTKIKLDSLEDIVDELVRLRETMKEVGWRYDQGMFKLVLRSDNAACGCYAGFIVEKCTETLSDDDFPEITHGTSKVRWAQNAAASVNVWAMMRVVYDIDSEWGNVLYCAFSYSRQGSVTEELLLHLHKDDDGRVREKIMQLEGLEK